jgi:hypothetical protein
MSTDRDNNGRSCFHYRATSHSSDSGGRAHFCCYRDGCSCGNRVREQHTTDHCAADH